MTQPKYEKWFEAKKELRSFGQDLAMSKSSVTINETNMLDATCRYKKASAGTPPIITTPAVLGEDRYRRIPVAAKQRSLMSKARNTRSHREGLERPQQHVPFWPRYGSTI